MLTKLPPSDQRATEILVVSSANPNRDQLRLLFAEPDWRVHVVRSMWEAAQLLDRRPIDVILCDHKLADGDWTDILAFASSAPFQPRVIVTSRHADERMWAEVLNLGGHDVLLEPFDSNEVRRVVQMALRLRAPLGGAVLAEADRGVA